MTIAILGGGISGLVAAFYLRQSGIKSKVLLIEGSQRLGGWINSHTSENGSLFELGPRTLRVGGNAAANTLKLAEDLNLSEKIIPIPKNHISARNRMIKVNGKLHLLPNSLKSTLTRIPPFSRPLAVDVLGELRSGSHFRTDESFFSFAQRKFGSEVASYVIDSLCRGVFAGSAKDLSVMAISKRIFNLDIKYHSVIRGLLFDKEFTEVKDESLNCRLNGLAQDEKWAVWSLQGGLQTLVNALESYASQNGIDIIKGEGIKEIRCKSGRASIATTNQVHEVDKAVSCIPANHLKDAVKSWNLELHKVLTDIPFVDVGIVNLEYPGSIVKDPGFGYLVPSCEPSKVLGVIYDSCVFPTKDKTVLTVMMGGYWFKQMFGDNVTTSELLSIAQDEISRTFDTAVKPIGYKASVLKKCIPQYTVGHYERVSNAKKLLTGSPLFLAGNSYDGVSINDTIYNTKKVISMLISQSHNL